MESVRPFEIRGHVCKSTLKYCREGMPEGRRQMALERLSGDAIRAVEGMRVNDWYMMDRMTEMLEAIISASEGDAATAEQDLIGVGKAIGWEATNSFLRLIIKVLTPGLFAKKLDAIYQRYNSKGKVSADVGEDRMIVSCTETKGFPHLAPIVLGWLRVVFEMMGKRIVSCRTTSWSLTNGDVDSFEVEFRWR